MSFLSPDFNNTGPMEFAPVAAPVDPGYVVFPANNWLYQVANVLLLISYVAPSILALRLILALASLAYALWGAFVLKISVDTVVWNTLFVIINLAQAGWIIYNMRPLKFEPEFELVYSQIFGPGHYNLSRFDYLPLTKAGFVRHIRKGRYYCHDEDDCNQLSVLIGGSFYVTKRVKKNKPLLIGIDEPVSFIDSPEWLNQKNAPKDPGASTTPLMTPRPDPDIEEGMMTPRSDTSGSSASRPETATKKRRLLQPQRYNVSIRAREDSTYVTWQYEVLSKVLEKYPNLISALDAVVGFDVYKKLIRAQELHIMDAELVDRMHSGPADEDMSAKSPRVPPGTESQQAKRRVAALLDIADKAKQTNTTITAPGKFDITEITEDRERVDATEGTEMTENYLEADARVRTKDEALFDELVDPEEGRDSEVDSSISSNQDKAGVDAVHGAPHLSSLKLPTRDAIQQRVQDAHSSPQKSVAFSGVAPSPPPAKTTKKHTHSPSPTESVSAGSSSPADLGAASGHAASAPPHDDDDQISAGSGEDDEIQSSPVSKREKLAAAAPKPAPIQGLVTSTSIHSESDEPNQKSTNKEIPQEVSHQKPKAKKKSTEEPVETADEPKPRKHKHTKKDD